MNTLLASNDDEAVIGRPDGSFFSLARSPYVEMKAWRDILKKLDTPEFTEREPIMVMLPMVENRAVIREETVILEKIEAPHGLVVKVGFSQSQEKWYVRR